MEIHGLGSGHGVALNLGDCDVFVANCLRD